MNRVWKIVCDAKRRRLTEQERLCELVLFQRQIKRMEETKNESTKN